MSYQVLARKWRPRRFAELVEQAHVVKALTHALDTGRLHHAYLFTGTRGVGKTTIARILAKSLNCETGVTSNPCGQCSACIEIDAGRFVDLLEVDAATNTRVDEMRQLLENAVYAPTRGRYKVYVIDEVHMLSNSAFNAMLKTLEEPPEHVKFVLATTDPQKIPVTVLSRCLQFSLRQMSREAIGAHLANICVKEGIAADDVALGYLADGARGSMRDALSLLDQAIAYCSGVLDADAVRTMLGTVDRGYLLSIIEHLAAGNLKEALEVAVDIQARSLSFDDALRGLAADLHRIALVQSVPDVLPAGATDRSRIQALATTIDAETVQLFYQAAVHGRSDLPLAPDEYAGFTMTLIRMACFRPSASQPVVGNEHEMKVPRPTPVKVITTRSAESVVASAPPVPPVMPSSVGSEQAFDGDWNKLTRELKLSGLARQLADRAELTGFDDKGIQLVVAQPDRSLADKPYQDRLRQAIQEALGKPIALAITIGKTNGASVAAVDEAARQSRTREAETLIRGDSFVRDLVSEFDATIESIKPIQ